MSLSLNFLLGEELHVLADGLATLSHLEDGFRSGKDVAELELFDFELLKNGGPDAEVSVLAELHNVLEEEGVLVAGVCSLLTPDVVGIDGVNLEGVKIQLMVELRYEKPRQVNNTIQQEGKI